MMPPPTTTTREWVGSALVARPRRPQPALSRPGALAAAVAGKAGIADCGQERLVRAPGHAAAAHELGHGYRVARICPASVRRGSSVLESPAGLPAPPTRQQQV